MTPAEEVILALLETAERVLRDGMEDHTMARHLVRFAAHVLVEPDIVEKTMSRVDIPDQDVERWKAEGKLGI